MSISFCCWKHQQVGLRTLWFVFAVTVHEQRFHNLSTHLNLRLWLNQLAVKTVFKGKGPSEGDNWLGWKRDYANLTMINFSLRCIFSDDSLERSILIDCSGGCEVLHIYFLMNRLSGATNNKIWLLKWMFQWLWHKCKYYTSFKEDYICCLLLLHGTSPRTIQQGRYVEECGFNLHI